MHHLASLTKATLCLLSLFILTACDVHEFPDPPEKRDLHINLHYNTDMPQWEYPLTNTRTIVPARTVQTTGEMKYVIRIYPQNVRSVRSADYEEFTFTRDISQGYDAEFDIQVPAGEYTMMVWSDMVEKPGDKYFYNSSDFSRISLQGEHVGNNDYRDAFRGYYDFSIASNINESNAQSITVQMERPLAKFEFVTDDVSEFIEKEIETAISRGEMLPPLEQTKALDFEKYTVMVYYNGFMPNTFDMFTDKPSDSTTGVVFQGRISQLNEDEATLGFDYVFVNGVESAVTVQIGIYNERGERISMTSPINVPLKRSKHTIVKGKFLMQTSSSGVSINPSFSGEHNVYI